MLELLSQYVAVSAALEAAEDRIAEVKARHKDELALLEQELDIDHLREEYDAIRLQVLADHNLGDDVTYANGVNVRKYSYRRYKVADERSVIRWAVQRDKFYLLTIRKAEINKVASGYEKAGDPIPDGIVIEDAETVAITIPKSGDEE